MARRVTGRVPRLQEPRMAFGGRAEVDAIAVAKFTGNGDSLAQSCGSECVRPDRHGIALGASPRGADVVAMMMRKDDGREARSKRLPRIHDVEQTPLFLGPLWSRADD